MAILEIDSIQKSFDHKPILSDVYVACHTGEVIGLLGSNGSGKSTLLKIVFGLISAEYKFVRIDNVVKKEPTDLFKEISYLSQDSFIPRSFSVQKAIRLSIEKVKSDSFYADEFIDLIKNKYVKELSGGELRYLEILLVLSNNSKFVLLDEPYTGLSPIMIERVNVLISKASETKGIIVSDHNYRSVVKISSKVVLLKNGKTHLITDKKQLLELGYVSEAGLNLL
ncbi:ATP-binding cassette domain-containing protein [Flavobacterium sp. TMP13]|uniref:ATP-binding cassette domain-containing protein n=1 Tax=Flavobacterium sp. TMP13 TaxID=3425950 RepID=UPI003D771D2D